MVRFICTGYHPPVPSLTHSTHSLAHSGQQQFAERKLNYPFLSLPMRRVKERYHCPPYHTNPYRTINRTYDTQISFLPSYSLAQSHLDRNKLIGRKQRLQLIDYNSDNPTILFFLPHHTRFLLCLGRRGTRVDACIRYRTLRRIPRPLCLFVVLCVCVWNLCRDPPVP